MERIGFIFEFLARGTELQREARPQNPPVATGLSYTTGVDFVFVFQDDTFSPTRRQKDSNFKPKLFNISSYVYDQDTLEVGTK